MKTNCFLLFLLCHLMATCANAQIFNKSSSTSSPTLPLLSGALTKAVDSATLILRVEYVLRDKKGLKKEEYGKDGLPYFGRAHGVAVASGGQFWFDGRMLEPWKYVDAESYDSYKNEEVYEPVVSSISIRRYHEEVFSEYDLEKSPPIKDGLVGIPLLDKYSEMPQLGALVPSLGDTTGFVILLTVQSTSAFRSKNLEGVSMQMESERITYKPNGSGLFKRSILTARATPAVGGFYCKLSSTTGKISVHFLGVLSVAANGYELDYLPMLQNIEKAKSNSSESESKLTPIPNEKKKKH